MMLSNIALSLLLMFGGDDKAIANAAAKSAPVVKAQGYDDNLVEVVNVEGQYDAVFMSRKGDRIKAKYFAAKDGQRTVKDRYEEWARGRNIIMYSSGTYMNSYKQPVGLTVDNGIMVNSTLESFDGVVIVYATGGVVGADIKRKDLKMRCDGTDIVFDLTDNFARQNFIDCSKKVLATVFQTHLLVYKNEIRVAPNSSKTRRERRFLAVCQDPKTKEVKHVLVNTPISAAATLLDATKQVSNMIKLYGAGDIVFMVNLDTGDGDVFRLFNNDGTERLKGDKDISQASNLLVYYYE